MRGLVWTLSVLFVISLAMNVFFISGKGVHITNRYEQHQNQQQAQLVLGLCSAGGHIRWRAEHPDNLIPFLETLSPEQALFAKITRSQVIYPEFFPVETGKEEGAEQAPQPRMNGQRILNRQ